MAIEFLDSSLVPFIGAFLFVFAIVFGLLSYAKKDGKDDKMFGFPKNVNAAIAAVFGIFAASFETFRAGLFNILPILVIPLVILFFLIFIKEVFTPKKDQQAFDAFPPVVLLSASLLLLAAFWDQIGFSVGELSSINVLWIIGILLIVGIFTVIYYHKPPKT